jgi:steroid 5-alpha reductase family enzyme
MRLVALPAAGWLLAAIVMAALRAWPRLLHTPVVDAAWTALVGGLAVLYANQGDGATPRRAAIAWMMGSWAARLTVQRLYVRARHDHGNPEDPRGDSPSQTFWSLQAHAASAVFFSLPALFSSMNPDPAFSSVELVACGIWMVGFAGETTADRQLLRFTSNDANTGSRCRAGLWRYSRRANEIFEGLIWVACALFASASPWGWLAFACPAAMACLIVRGNASHLPLPALVSKPRWS